jgi:WD40 repeat protein/mono/diheme cytochrome c family protein
MTLTIVARAAAVLSFAFGFTALAYGGDSKPATPERVSYFKQVLPIFQAHCQGCHQPAKARGDYVMTVHDKLLAGGASGKKAVLPGEPAKSHLIELITPIDGKAQMPEGKKPLDKDEIALIARWIAEGAKDDSPANTAHLFDAEHPPIYTYQPIIPSIDYAPDGKYLAVAGFHEVLLVDAVTLKLAGRLIGMAERIQSVRFSPDGARLAVSGGLPGRMGEVQVWDVAKQKLKLSVPVTYDTLFGVSWSPDGSRLAFGCTDKTVRVIEADSGQAICQQGSHDDWVLDTFFTVDGAHVVSAGRDMAVKLTEVATQRFIDNVTSITPNALKGGVQALTRHPKLNVFIAGGSDGVPRAYRVFRETARQIGDDANLIGELYPMVGRVFGTRFSADGRLIAACSSLDNHGEVLLASYDYTEDVPKELIRIMGKVPGTRTPEEKQALADYRAKGMRLIARIPHDKTGVYAVAFQPDGKVLASAGGDGKIRLFDTKDGKLIKEFAPAPVQPVAKKDAIITLTFPKDEPVDAEKLPTGAKVKAIEVSPNSIQLDNPYAYTQLVVTARLANGDAFDATRLAQMQPSSAALTVNSTGLVRPRVDGVGTLQVHFDGHSATIPFKVNGLKTSYTADFVHDVNPVLGRLGCNQGTCHGANKGRNGFKLSLRGVDAEFDVRAFLDDHAGRRANVASPDYSLMLLKASGAVPHVGGALTKPGEPYYELLRNWIGNGARLNLKTPRVQKIEIQPANPIVQRPGERQQFRVLATYADGKIKDVTREAFIESGNSEVASSDKTGLLTAVRRGEAPVLARFEGAYVATMLLVMGERDGFVWKDPPVFNKIDELTAAKWKRMKIQPSELADDLDFLRRVHLDLTGLPPTADDVVAFQKDSRETQVKRAAVIDRLIGSDDYVDYWTNKWADLLTVNRRYLGVEGAMKFREWIRGEIAANTPYDVFARKVLTASGSNKANPPASYFKVHRDPAAIMENTTHLFLAIRFNCNKCHDHPFERWTQDQYYETAAYFARVGLAADPASGGQTIGKTAVNSGSPLFEVVFDKKDGEVKHDRTGLVTPPKFPYPAKTETKASGTRRDALAAWITSPDNQYFAKSYVNRLWGYFFGTGIIDPIDDIRAGNPPTNPELLDYLTKEFIDSGFDVRHMHRLITNSRTYQLSVVPNPFNEDDRTNYSRAIPRRLPAEVLYDSLLRAMGSKGKLPGGGRAATLPDSGVDLPSGFLATFGRPARDTSCECERTSGIEMGPVMALVNGQTIAEIIAEPNNALANLVAQQKDDKALINQLFLRILNRPASADEIDKCLAAAREIEADHKKLEAAVTAREQELIVLKPKLEKQRLEAIAKAKAELDAYEKEIAPKVAVLEKQRKEAIAKATEALKKYQAALPEKEAAWEKKQDLRVDWKLVKPASAVGSKDVTLKIEDDSSVTAGGKAGRDTYTVVFHTDIKEISAIRLEAIADPKYPKGGPGRAPDGNFVLTEMQVFVQPKGSKELPKRIDLVKPLASFSQKDFDVKFAIDGDEGSRDKGWAVSPATGITHWATFQLKEPLLAEKGVTLTVKFITQFQQQAYTLGRFRLSFATGKQPVGLSIAEDYRRILETPSDKRTKAQKDALGKLYRLTDTELQKRQQDVADASKPLPVDPRLAELKTTLDQVSLPLREDERLAQLKRDVEQSRAQVANLRLTAAQDIAWSLINTPAFLFNR